MKKIVFLIVLISYNCAISQILKPVEFEITSKKIEKNTFEVHLKAEVLKSWHIYSQNTEDGGPLPTDITFITNAHVTVLGKPKELGEVHEKFEEVFGVNTKYYEGSVDFVQMVKTQTNKPVTLEGNIAYMACKEGMCLTPQEVPFKISLL